MSVRLRTRRNDEESGNATVGFVATIGMLLLLVWTLLSLVMTWYVSEILRDSAAAGARYASLDRSSLSAGRDRAAELITATLPVAYAADISIRLVGNDVVVTARAPAPLRDLLTPETIEVSARAPVE